MRSFAIDEPRSSVRALYVTLEDTKKDIFLPVRANSIPAAVKQCDRLLKNSIGPVFKTADKYASLYKRLERLPKTGIQRLVLAWGKSSCVAALQKGVWQNDLESYHRWLGACLGFNALFCG